MSLLLPPCQFTPPWAGQSTVTVHPPEYFARGNPPRRLLFRKAQRHCCHLFWPCIGRLSQLQRLSQTYRDEQVLLALDSCAFACAETVPCMRRFPNSWIAAALNTSTNFTSALARSYRTLTSDVVPASLTVPPSQ